MYDIAGYRCTGCTACQNICPLGCISLIENEMGFKYPSIDLEKCISCNKCICICPVINQHTQNFIKPKTYTVAIQNKNEMMRSKSSAGGAFAAIAVYVLQKNGIVFGAGFDENLMVRHKYVENIKEFELSDLCSSKYMASEIGKVFVKVRDFLEQDRWVCFVGLPCQAAGLSSFLGKKYDKLVLVDLTCYGVPSPSIYRKYLDYCSAKFSSEVVSINFRDKSYGYSAPSVLLKLKNGLAKCQNSAVKSFLRLFFEGYISRDSCFNCCFKTVDRVSDFTLGDCKSIGKYYSLMDDDKGTTIIFVHSNMGEKILDDLSDNLIIKKVNVNDILEDSGKKMTLNAVPNCRREDFWLDYKTLPYNKLVNKYSPPKNKEKLATAIKPILKKIGLIDCGLLKQIKSFV